MKLGRVASPLGVNGDVWKTISRDGSASSPGLTAIRPARPRLCGPSDVMAPVYGAVPSTKNGSSGPPDVRLVTVTLADAALMSTLLAPPSSMMRSVLPAGLENCSDVEPSRLLSWATTDAMPPE